MELRIIQLFDEHCSCHLQGECLRKRWIILSIQHDSFSKTEAADTVLALNVQKIVNLLHSHSHFAITDEESYELLWPTAAGGPSHPGTRTAVVLTR